VGSNSNALESSDKEYSTRELFQISNVELQRISSKMNQQEAKVFFIINYLWR
jgi:hypothetical protein